MLGKWEVPIYNDMYVMLFFGILKKLVSKWLAENPTQVEHNRNYTNSIQIVYNSIGD